jgi:hypothetical protein
VLGLTQYNLVDFAGSKATHSTGKNIV